MPAPGGLKIRWKFGNEEASDNVRERENWNQELLRIRNIKLEAVSPEYSFFVLNTFPWNHKLTSFQAWKNISSFKIRLLQLSA